MAARESALDENVAQSRAYQFGDWFVEVRLNRIRREGEEIQLEPRTMDVLAYFIERPRQVVSFDELLDRFWQGRIVNQGTIYRRIRQIRRILGDDATNPEYIETIRKRGYRTIAPVRSVAIDEHASDLRSVLQSQTPPFAAYEGNEPYVFICYAHHDRAHVYPELIRLRDAGVNIWYDEGIPPGSEWTEELAKAIADCSRFLYFISPTAVASTNCRDEVQYAREAGKPIVTVHFEPTELPEGLRLEIGRIQALFKYQLKEPDYRRKLDSALGESPSATSVRSSSEMAAPIADHKRARWRYLGLAAVMVAVVGSVFIAVRLMTLTDASSLLRRTPAASIQSVAVPPFVDMSPVGDYRSIGESIALEISTELSKREGTQVLSRTTSSSAPEGLSSQEIGEHLGVDLLVEGTIRRSGEWIRVTVQLVSVIDGYQLWAEVYDARLGDKFSGEIEVASSITKGLLEHLGSPMGSRVQIADLSGPSEGGLAGLLGEPVFDQLDLGDIAVSSEEEQTDEK